MADFGYVGFYVLKLIICNQRYVLFSIKLLLMFIQKKLLLNKVNFTTINLNPIN